MPEDPAKPAKKAVGGELIIPIAAIAFTVYYIASIIDAPWEAQVNAFFIGGLLILLALLFIVLTLNSIRHGQASWGLGKLLTPVRLVPKRLLLFALTLGYITALEWVGFTLCTFIFLLCAMLLLTEAQRPWLVLGLASGLSLSAYFLFIIAFETRFPRGPFEQFMQSLF